MTTVTLKYSDLLKQYDGTGDFLEWVQKLEMVAQLQNIKDKHNFMPLFLSGGAFAVYQGLSAKEREKYDVVKKKLTAAFSVDSFQAYQSFVSRRLRVDESVDVYVADLKRLGMLVTKEKVDESWLLAAFVLGLPDSVKNQLRASCDLSDMSFGATVEKARTLVGTREICCAGMVKNGSNQVTCFGCGGPGHTRRECPKNRNGSQRGMACHKCGGSGHVSRVCPTRNEDATGNRMLCFACGEPGHRAVDCPKKSKNA